jgi:hypothetical protein
MPTIRGIVETLDSKPTGVILAALLGLVVFIWQPVNYGFAAGHHGILSSQGMTIAANLSLQRHGFMYDHVSMGPDGRVVYSGYNRFPVTYFAMVKGAFVVAGEDVRRQFLFARILTSAFCAAAFLCAFLSLRLLCAASLPALCATLLAFSSMYIYYYSDMIFNDMPSLFGCLLVFHGMIVHARTDRRGQLYLKKLIGI